MERERRATTEDLLAHAGWVRALSRLLVADPHAAADLEQDAWLAALEHPPLAGDGLRAWWVRVLKNRAIDTRRSRSRRMEHESGALPPRDEHTPLETSAALDAQRRLVAAIDALEEPLRSTVVRRYVQGLAATRIAELDGVPESTVRTRLQRALEKLRSELDERTPGGRAAWTALLLPFAVADAAPAGVGLTIVIAAGLVAAVGAAGWMLLTRDGGPVQGSRSQVAAVQGGKEDAGLAEPAVGAERASAVVAEAPLQPAAVASEPVARFEARFVDAQGRALRAVELVCVDRSSLGEIPFGDAPRATSGSDGRVALELHASDRSTRRVRNAAADPARITFQLQAGGPSTRSRALSAAGRLGVTQDLGDVILAPGTRVTGRVVDEDGAPLARAAVELVAPDLSPDEFEAALGGAFWRKQQAARVPSDDRGVFVFEGAPVGTFRAVARSDVRAQAISEPLVLDAGVPVVVPDLVCAESPRRVSGRLRLPDGSAPKRGEVEWLFARDGQRSWVGGGSVAKDGTFSIVGDLRAPISIAARGTSPATGEAIVHDVAPGTTGLEIVLPERREIEIVVRDPSGAPIEDFSSGVSVVDGGGEYGRTHHPGGVVRETARAMPFRVQIGSPGYEELEFGPFEAATAPARLDVVLRRVPELHGRVVAEGRVLRGTSVHLSPLLPAPITGRRGFETRLGEPVSTVDVDTEGRFALPVTAHGLHVAWSISEHGDARSEPFDPAADPSHEVVLDLEPCGAIEGRVLVPADCAEERILVILANGLPEPRVVIARPDGSFTAERLGPGAWSVVAEVGLPYIEDVFEGAPYADHPAIQRVNVVAGGVAACTIDLAAGGLRGVDGRLALARSPARTWIAGLTRRGEPESARVTAPLRDDGSFDVHARGPGPHRLELRAVGGADRADSIACDLVLLHGPLAWKLERETGALELDGPPHATRVLVADLGPSGTWTTRFRLDANGHATLAGLPGGAARIEDPADDTPALEVVVRSGSTTTASLR